MLLNLLDLNECKEKTCGELCSKGVCDGYGYCVNSEENLCTVPENPCDSKECGDECLLGDILGVCNAIGECDSGVDSVIRSGQCGIFIKIMMNLMISFKI